MPGQQPGMDGSAVLLLHRLSGTFPTLITAGCCPSAAGCRATVCGASRRTTPATSGYWAGPLEGEWSGRAGWCASRDCFIGASAPYLCGDPRSNASEVCGWGGPASRWWRWVTVRAEVKLERPQRARTSKLDAGEGRGSLVHREAGWISAPGSPSRILGAGQRGCVRASAQPYLGARTRYRAGPATRCWIGDRVCAATQSLEAAGGKAVAAGAVRA